MRERSSCFKNRGESVAIGWGPMAKHVDKEDEAGVWTRETKTLKELKQKFRLQYECFEYNQSTKRRVGGHGSSRRGVGGGEKSEAVSQKRGGAISQRQRAEADGPTAAGSWCLTGDCLVVGLEKREKKKKKKKKKKCLKQAKSNQPVTLLKSMAIASCRGLNLRGDKLDLTRTSDEEAQSSFFPIATPLLTIPSTFLTSFASSIT
ncbi:serine carboxypeptidase-like 51 [Striga asiatica]|uniref:Serine carboxypeptidase-like 51 n=1 Tax=Striga asiatica TaxID=4170 RepID=A0A5A7PNC8_STRAF|nr:serine carboxypeptidase-like 51 [Striga asiatica]